jgi:endonuclease YncB( thermonuclease family)
MRDRQRTWQYDACRCRRGLCLWILGLLLLPLLVQAEQFTGKVVGIRTGDTLSVLRSGRVVQVHLYGVACPEGRQAFSTQARQFTRDVAFRQTVAVVVDAVAMNGTDRRGRLVAAVQLPDGRDLSQALVQAGYAWHDTRYAPYDKRLAQLEAEAQAAQRGLWADANSVPPWERDQGQRRPTSAEVPQGPDSSQTVIIGHRYRKVYYWPGCPEYNKISRRNRAVFQGREAAERAGYRPAENCP